MNELTSLKLLIIILTFSVVGTVIPVAFAEIVFNTENGNYYEYVADTTITWTEAKAASEAQTFDGVNGHLVTITSQSENDFVSTGVHPNDFRAWIGLSDESTEGTYEWVTGEPFDYSSWNTGEPSYDAYEDYIEFFSGNGSWNDVSDNNQYLNGYIIEYDHYSPPVLNTLNGHYYKYIPEDVSWYDAVIKASLSEHNGIQGHLVTITDITENSFVTQLVPPGATSWIGMHDDFIEGSYTWINSEPINYFNWANNQPDNYNNEDFIELNGWTGKWNDNNVLSTLTTGYVIEYSDYLDIDGDGIPDEYDNCPNTFNSDQNDIDGNGIGYVCQPRDTFIQEISDPENNVQYLISIRSDFTWIDAYMHAQTFSKPEFTASLATIKDQETNDLIKSHIPENTTLWIGLDDSISEGTYEWVDDEPLTYSNWADGVSNNNNTNDYVSINSDGEWITTSVVETNADGYILELRLNN